MPVPTGRAADRARRHFFEALSASYAPPALLIDANDRIAAMSGNLEPFLKAATYAGGEHAFASLCDDVGDEVRLVARVARCEHRPASGFVVLQRHGPIPCKVVALPLQLPDGFFLRVIFEMPLATLAERPKA